jgi:very-short-patch-repair endonuclease
MNGIGTEVRPSPHRAISALAARQHGVLTRTQLVAAGLSPDTVDRSARSGRLTRLYRGVYQLGPLGTPDTRLLAGVLACGPHAVLARRSSGGYWGFLPPTYGPDVVEVLIRRGRAGSMAGVSARCGRTVADDEVTVRNGIPITTPERTLFDLATELGSRELERALAEAEALRLVARKRLLAVVRRNAGRPGARSLAALLADGTAARTRSEAEEQLLGLVRLSGLPAPQCNVRVAGLEVDFLWRTARLVVEVDGEAYHSSAARFESDRRRDARLLAAGLRVMRITWRQLVDEREAVLVRLTQALGQPASL